MNKRKIYIFLILIIAIFMIIFVVLKNKKTNYKEFNQLDLSDLNEEIEKANEKQKELEEENEEEQFYEYSDAPEGWEPPIEEKKEEDTTSTERWPDGSETVSKKYEVNDNEIEVKYNPTGGTQIKLNEVEVVTVPSGVSISNLNTYDDILVYTATLGDIMTLFIKYPNKEIPDSYSSLDEHIYLSSFEINDKKIILYGEAPKLMGKENTFMFSIAGGSVAEINNCNDYNKYKNYKYSGVYELEYLGNGKFSKLKTISTKTMGEAGVFKEYCNE